MHIIKELNIREEEVITCSGRRAFVCETVGGEISRSQAAFQYQSTYVRSLEEKGYLSHDAFGTTYRYFPCITEEQYGTAT